MQPDAALAQLGAEGHQVQHGAGEPVESGDLQCAALAQQLEDEFEPCRSDGRSRGGSMTAVSRVPPVIATAAVPNAATRTGADGWPTGIDANDPSSMTCGLPAVPGVVEDPVLTMRV
ncbi:hypothetical protein [Streptomyces sp. NPDC088246]|uniref:hypothetical protein n=1 Tax=Streptomyces sp. NPDC088246 TaxID=3365842 RepID=UPI0038021E95